MHKLNLFATGSILSIFFGGTAIFAAENDNNQTSSNNNFKFLCFKKKLHFTEFEIPTGSKAFTSKDYNRVTIYPFLKRWLGYNEEKRKDPLLDDLCKAWAGMQSQEEARKTLETAKKRLKKNPNDAISFIITFHYNRNYFSSRDWRRKAIQCRREERNSFYNYLLSWIYITCGPKPYNTDRLLNLALQFASRNKLCPRDSQYICRIIEELTGCQNSHKLSGKIQSIHPKNVWLKNVLLGKLYISKAWQARGSGWANTVTKDGWRGFEENIKKAKKCLTEAWEMHRDMPIPAVQMITVAKAQGSVAERIQWFNRAVAGQADYSPAYSRIQDALLPRWCGSVKLLKKLGDACYKTHMFKERIPFWTPSYYRSASAETYDYRWQLVYRTPKTIDKLEEIMKHWCKHESNATIANKNYFIASCAMYNFYAGRYDKAQKLIKQMGHDNFTNVETSFQQHNYSYFPTWIKVAEQIKFFTGRFGNELRKAENDFLNYKTTAALAGLEKLLKNKKLSANERSFVTELWARYSLETCAYKFLYNKNALFAACNTGNLEIAQKLLDSGIDINSKSTTGKTPLYEAAYINLNLPATKFLIKNGAKVNIKDSKGYPLIFKVALQGNAAKIIKYLVKAGANIEARSKNGMTPLMNAIYNKKFGNIKALVESGANVNAKVGSYRVWDYVKHVNIPKITAYMKEHGCK